MKDLALILSASDTIMDSFFSEDDPPVDVDNVDDDDDDDDCRHRLLKVDEEVG
ncbi:hypothetical protein Wxf_00015 [Armadillidium vulgare]|nr:hypothetical protein Wxf_00015 [Armadillidium vulgare] [Wolbachia endosymbiont of Armadillidium vulgare]